MAYADANFAPLGDRKSQTGGLICFNGSTVDWTSKKQKTVSLSTAEAEYVSLATVACSVLWFQQLLEELTAILLP
jgi:hypothetical protein